MPYYIASDHAGFALKNMLKQSLANRYLFKDLGCYIDEKVDYPGIAVKLAKKVAKDVEAKGILVCGTGIGMCIVANKVSGTRAASIHDIFTARMARKHNNANIACIGARNIGDEIALQLVETFLETGFEGEFEEGKRHLKRVKKIGKIEEKHFK